MTEDILADGDALADLVRVTASRLQKAGILRRISMRVGWWRVLSGEMRPRCLCTLKRLCPIKRGTFWTLLSHVVSSANLSGVFWGVDFGR